MPGERGEDVVDVTVSAEAFHKLAGFIIPLGRGQRLDSRLRQMHRLISISPTYRLSLLILHLVRARCPHMAPDHRSGRVVYPAPGLLFESRKRGGKPPFPTCDPAKAFLLICPQVRDLGNS